MVQQLKLKLKHKKMVFSQDHIKLTKVVGQGINFDFQHLLYIAPRALHQHYSAPIPTSTMQEKQVWCIADTLMVKLVKTW